MVNRVFKVYWPVIGITMPFLLRRKMTINRHMMYYDGLLSCVFKADIQFIDFNIRKFFKFYFRLCKKLLFGRKYICT